MKKVNYYSVKIISNLNTVYIDQCTNFELEIYVDILKQARATSISIELFLDKIK